MEPGVDLELRLGQPGQEVPLGRIEGEPNLPENEDRGRREAAREQRSLEREVTKLEQLHTRFREEADQFLQRNGIQVADPEKKKKKKQSSNAIEKHQKKKGGLTRDDVGQGVIERCLGVVAVSSKGCVLLE